MIKIRKPESTDSTALIELIQQFPTPHPSSAAKLAEMLMQKLGDSAAYMLVAENELGLVGYVSGYRHAAFYAGGETAWGDEVLVSESLRDRFFLL